VRQLHNIAQKQGIMTSELSNRQNRKLHAALIKHVYMQAHIGAAASTFCASIIFIALFEAQKNNSPLFLWGSLFLIITIARVIFTILYKTQHYLGQRINLWRNLYILGSALGGTTWGYLGVFLLPHANAAQQSLIVLMTAGVTAGAVPLSAAIPEAAIAFLVLTIFPFIMSILLFEDSTFLLFDMALSLYLLYTIVLTIKIYKLIKNSIVLQFENNLLLTHLEISNKKLEHAATHDALTQVANRRLFIENLKKSIESAKKNNAMLALFYIDLDNFKSANDRYGHQAGDRILIAAIERLKNYFQKDDHIARLGGDELAIIIENAQNKNEIEMIARDICHLIALPIEMDNIILHVSASIGISIYPYDGQEMEMLLHRADEYMYSVKENGGNNFYFSKELKEFS